jgi:predicted AlkP superfamily pyrophosphatase or phosphodiesterase
VVVAVVDQLRPDLLTRYSSCFRGGLRRLQDEAFRFENATHDHAVTNTAPGHATLATGALPSQHGIVDNAWYERVDGRFVGVAAVSDTTAHIPGEPQIRGASPHRLRASTLAEWMQEQHSDARVVSVAGKDRSAIFLAGRVRAHVYWFSRSAGRFVTSSRYSEREPDWVQRFHADVWPTFSADSVWTCSTPSEWRALAREDDVPFETAREPVFPHRFEPPAPPPASPGSNEPSHTSTRRDEQRAISQAYWRWFYGSPRLDAATLELAITAMRAEGLGQDDTPDYLAVALSATDVIGHDFGPLSLEQLDNLLHLDRALGRFFDVLDAEVGAGRWVLGLSADHGVATMPEQLQANGVEARRVPRDEIEALFTDLKAAVDVYGRTGVLSSSVELERVLATRTAATDYVAAAMPRAELALAATGFADKDKTHGAADHAATPHAALNISPGDPFVRLYRNSYYEGRILGGPLWSRAQRVSLGTYGVEARLKENVNVHGTDAIHGSPYRYDRHVPLMFMGRGIDAGTSDERVRTVDLAPTLAKLLGVPVPADRAGRALAFLTAQ